MNFRKRIILTSLILLAIPVLTAGQEFLQGAGIRDAEKSDGTGSLINVSTYHFSAQSGVGLEDMSTGTTQLISPGSDNDNSLLAPIGFVFRFDGVYYTDFGVNANGLVKLGGVTTSTNTLNAINTVTNAPKIMPYWDDLCVGSGGKVHYKTIGSPGNRKLIVEWKNMKITRGTGCDGTGGGTFQMWLFDHTGVIQFVYGNGMAASSATNGGYSIGMQSGAASNFASITSSNNTVSYTTANNSQTDAIIAGTSYLLSPNIPAAASNGTANPVTQTSVTLNWNDNAGDETGYAVRRTRDNVNFVLPAGNLPVNTTTFNDTGLTAGTQYFYYVNAFSDGALSPDLVIPVTTNPAITVTSTAAGGPWSSPSTWSSGLVPQAFDDVVIADGATVIIDTAAFAGNVTIGTGGSLAEGEKTVAVEGGPARLTFEESTGRTLTVSGNVTIGSNGEFSTGGGNANAHILRVGGNLTNNGVLDFSTSNNQAGATINFFGSPNVIFGGTGPVTDIMSLDIHKTGPQTVVELTVSNFTVRGSSTDTPGSNYLFLYEGIFKISGTFTGAHRTFPNAAYTVPTEAGLWLNNPNYTVTAQNARPIFHGYFRITAGNFNVGTTADDWLTGLSTAFIMEGGKLNLAGSMINEASLITISGGTVTACRVGPGGICFVSMKPPQPDGAISMSGGEIVLQNSAHYQYPATTLQTENFRGTTVRFGNAFTNGPGTFTAAGQLPNVVIDTTAFPMSVETTTTNTHVNNVNIGPGGLLKFPSLSFHGTTFVNNGELRGTGGNFGTLEVDDYLSGLSDVNFSGTGIMTGLAAVFSIRCHRITFHPALGNLITRLLRLKGGTQVTNAARITLGTNDTTISDVELFDGASIDMPLDFNLGPNGQRVTYTNVPTTGFEINQARILNRLTTNGPLTITGGDLTITTAMGAGGGVISTGQNILTMPLRNEFVGGYIDGNLRMVFGPGNVNHDYFYPVGIGSTGVWITVTSITNPSALTIKAIDTTLPGLLPGTSATRYWKLTEEGDIKGRLGFVYTDADVRGSEANYTIWESTGGTPIQVPSTAFPQENQVLTNSSDFNIRTSNLGIGEMLDPGPVSVSGTVTTAGGQPIRNALLTISGGNLPAPVQTQTGNFGTYIFEGLQAGETYTIRVDAKRFRFSPVTQQVTPLGNVGNVNFVANP